MNIKLVILANSYREGDRCIAGIDISTGLWVRPVSPLKNMAITWNMRKINNNESGLMDIVEMSLGEQGRDLGCQPENRLLNAVPWQKVGKMTVHQISEYIEDSTVILHDHSNSIQLSHLKIPKTEWKSLQLIKSPDVKFEFNEYLRRWRTIFGYGDGKSLELGLTDPNIINKLNRGIRISQQCLLTISLAGPLSPYNYCYKLVAGVIEL